MKTNLVYFFVFVLIYSIADNSYAQKFQIKGRVVEVNDSAVFCNVGLMNEKNVLVCSATTNADGAFELNNISKSNYLLIVSSIGFNADTIFIRELSKDLDIGTIYLHPVIINLNEVTVTAKNIINKNGIRYVIPTQNQIRNSTNGIMLLDKMNLPRLHVDGVSNSIQISGGGSVQLRINGREVTSQEINALQPNEIIRIEYHDKPEARYNYAEVVLDYIVRHQESGGYIYTELWNGLLKKFGEDRIVVKLNHKKSEFSALYYLAYRDWNNHWRKNHETFNLGNGSIIRDERGIPADFEYYNHRVSMNYNYQDGGKLFNVSFIAQLNNQVHNDWKSNLSSSTSSVPISMIDSSQNKLKNPSLNVYYQYPFNNREMLIFNVSGLFNKGSYNRYYNESENNLNLTNLSSKVDEKQYAGGFSLLYENKQKAGTLNVGIEEKSTLTTDTYENSFQSANTTNVSSLDIHNSYLFTQFGNQLNKWYYRVGIGANVNWQIVDKKVYHYIYFRPSLTLVYSPNDDLSFTYANSVYINNPSLSALSDYVQYIDSLQVRKGNSALKPQKNYYNALSVELNKKKFGVSYYLNYTYADSPLMESTYLEKNVVIRTIENQKRFQKINSELELRAKPYENYFVIKIYAGINHYISEGNTYQHIHSIYYYGGKFSANYKKFTLSWVLNQNTSDSFWGETLSRGESAHMASLSYNTSNYYIGFDCINMFSTKHIGSKDNYNDVAPYSRYEYLSELRNLVRFKVTYTLRYGRKYNASNRQIKSSDSTESGILKGEK